MSTLNVEIPQKMHWAGTWSWSGSSTHYNNLLLCPSCNSLSWVVFRCSCMQIFKECGNGHTRCWPSYIVLLAIDMVMWELGVLLWFGFFSERWSITGFCFCVYSLAICIIKQHLNPGIIHLLKQVSVLFPCVKHASSIFRDADGIWKKLKKPTRQKH